MKDLVRDFIFLLYKYFFFVYKKFDNVIEYKRKKLLNKRFKLIGQNSIINRHSMITNPQYISIGSAFCSLHNLRIEAIDEYKGVRYAPSINIGDNVSLNSDCHLGAVHNITIGNNVLIGSRVLIIDHSHGEINRKSLRIIPMLRTLYTKGPIIIGDNVWIGEGVCILSGVTIGENAIIGANSVVTKSVPANAVAGGNPAKILRILT